MAKISLIFSFSSLIQVPVCSAAPKGGVLVTQPCVFIYPLHNKLFAPSHGLPWPACLAAVDIVY